MEQAWFRWSLHLVIKSHGSRKCLPTNMVPLRTSNRVSTVSLFSRLLHLYKLGWNFTTKVSPVVLLFSLFTYDQNGSLQYRTMDWWSIVERSSPTMVKRKKSISISNLSSPSIHRSTCVTTNFTPRWVLGICNRRSEGVWGQWHASCSWSYRYIRLGSLGITSSADRWFSLRFHHHGW